MAKQKGGKKNRAEEVERETLEKVAPIVAQYGYELWDVIFEKEGALWYLKVLFDKPDGGIDDEECEQITGPLNEAIDTLSCLELIDVAEVGSPGLDRQLRKPEHFERMMGQPIRAAVRTDNGVTNYHSGELCGYDAEQGTVTLMIDGKEQSFALSRCKRINLDL
ncbi:MAG: ribosome assembly cofactor RimP [Eubacterium sp.]|nr:ribosome assembly cofactor RimP [Eubacterium sp.]